jgi:hypothetical protein
MQVWWLLLFVLAFLLSAVAWYCQLALPRMEHDWADVGQRPPLWGAVLIGASRLAIRVRFIAPIVLCVVAFARFFWPRGRRSASDPRCQE